MSWRDKIAAVLAGKVGGPTPTGIHVYHSSPHDFDRFDLSKIGTGEGAQVYGHGIYAAENPAVSGQGGQYWNQFSGRFPKHEELAAGYLQETGFDRAKAIELARQEGARISTPALRDRIQQSAELLRSGAPVGPRTYEVNFKAKPEELLDWDKPITQQSGVLDAVKSLGVDPFRENKWWGPSKPWNGPTNWTNNGYFVREVPKGFEYGQGSVWDSPALGRARSVEAAQQKLAPIFEPKPKLGSEVMRDLKMRNEGFGPDFGATTSQQLRDVGVPGVRYLDELSRAAGQGTSNYVAFDPSKLDIMAKYGVVGGVPLGAATMGGTIDQSTYGERQ